MWVFGYGSLIWKADFPFKQKLVGYIKGYKRRFYQLSVDHRGRPSLPGRVVTLVPSSDNDKVWGLAYEIYPADIQVVIEHLDYREKTGYKKHTVLFYPHIVKTETSNDGKRMSSTIPSDLAPFNLTIYIGTEDNDWYAGPASEDVIARQIVKCSGPSGTNKEYLYKLADAMRMIAPGVDDEHLFSLEAAVRNLDEDGTQTNGNQ